MSLGENPSWHRPDSLSEVSGRHRCFDGSSADGLIPTDYERPLNGRRLQGGQQTMKDRSKEATWVVESSVAQECRT
jgi:hypothetical protein